MELLLLFRYPPGSAPALLMMVLARLGLPVRFVLGVYQLRRAVLPTLSLLVDEEVGIVRVESGRDGVHLVSGPGGGGKRFRQNKKPCTPRG